MNLILKGLTKEDLYILGRVIDASEDTDYSKKYLERLIKCMEENGLDYISGDWSEYEGVEMNQNFSDRSIRSTAADWVYLCKDESNSAFLYLSTLKDILSWMDSEITIEIKLAGDA